jgi:hypothetical protein
MEERSGVRIARRHTERLHRETDFGQAGEDLAAISRGRAPAIRDDTSRR